MTRALAEADLAPYCDLPFRERGRSRAGVDCWGLVWLIYREMLGLGLPDHGEDYRSLKDKHAISETIAREQALARTPLSGWAEIDGGQDGADLRPLDLVIFRLVGDPWHLGLCLGTWRAPPSFLHILDESGVQISPLHGRLWGRRKREYYRHERLG